MLCAENISDLFVNIFAWGRKGQNETIKAGPNIFWQKSIFLRNTYGGIQVSRNGVLTKAILIGDPGNTRHRGKYHPTVDFLFEWFGFDPTSKAVTNST